MDEGNIHKVIALYGLHAQKVLPVTRGYRNQCYPVQLSDGRTVNVILYKHESGILNIITHTNLLTRDLAFSSLPVRHPIDDRIITVKSANICRYIGLYNFLPGDTIPWESYSMEHLKCLGSTMRKLHYSLKACRYVELPHTAGQYGVILDQIQNYFMNPDITVALRQKLNIQINLGCFEQHKEVLARCNILPGQQPLHMDFVRSNILFASEKPECKSVDISGILDFEKASIGIPLFDLARTLAFLYVDCDKPIEKVRKYFLYSGYRQHNRYAIKNYTVDFGSRCMTLLDYLVDLFLLYDLFKFLKHNPYEDLILNAHFLKTKCLLIHAGILAISQPNGKSTQLLLKLL